MDIQITLAAGFAATSVIILLIWLEHRPREPGNPRLIPLTPLLFLAIFVLIVILAHLVTVLTGEPHLGRAGR